MKYPKREKRPEIEREKQPAHTGLARGIRIHMTPVTIPGSGSVTQR